MQKFRVNLKQKIEKYTKLSNVSYQYFREVGIGNLSDIVRNGSARFKTLFEVCKVLNVDVRNFLMFDNNTYIFKNSFDSFEEFKSFLGDNYRKIRSEKKITVLEIESKLDFKKESVYSFEVRKVCSLPRFYEFIDALEISVEEFFLKDEEYKVKVNGEIREIIVDEFNNRIYEIEEIKNKKLCESIAYDSRKFPTFHQFLKICSSLRIDPGDFFNFEKKDFEECKSTDFKKSIAIIKDKINSQNLNTQNHIKLDTIFLFCYENGIEVKNFFDSNYLEDNLNQLFMSIS